MAPRLGKTLADYVVIAIIPALIMVLVGSLVFFLITAFYHGQFQARLQFIFAMFVLAAVLIGRISMEQGTEYASLFALPLAIVTSLAMWRFVELQGPLAPFGWLINLGLMALVWWSAHKLTWDCTLIEEHEDAAGEGLLQLVGLDADRNAAEHERVAEARRGQSDVAAAERGASWWQRFTRRRRQPHAPGRWVVYFSLAALPLFGFGQAMIPAEDAESRRYAFQLLFLYVASGLGLLLTTSFLGLRRYLRQRSLEMPAEMTAVWLGTGALLILVLLVLCALLPRPSAGFRLTKLPIRFEAPQDVRPSRYGFGDDGPRDPQGASRYRNDSDSDPSSAATSGSRSQGGDDGSSSAQARSNNSGQQGTGGHSNGHSGGGQQNRGEQNGGQQGGGQQGGGQQGGKQQGGKQQGGKQQGGGEQGGGEQRGGQQAGGQQAGGQQGGAQQSGAPQDGGDRSGGRPGERQRDAGQSGTRRQSDASGRDGQRSGEAGATPSDHAENGERDESAASGGERSGRRFAGESSGSDRATDGTEGRQGSSAQPVASSDSGRSRNTMPRVRFSGLGETLTWLIKALFYLGLAVLAVYLVWRHWAEIKRALRTLVDGLRDFWHRWFGGPRGAENVGAGEREMVEASRPFSDFADPFTSGAAARLPAAELVRYSFEALEAWARECGCPRDPQQTAHEFARQVARRDAQLSGPALQLADLYARLAYAAAAPPQAGVESLRELWRRMTAGSGDAHSRPL